MSSMAKSFPNPTPDASVIQIFAEPEEAVKQPSIHIQSQRAPATPDPMVAPFTLRFKTEGETGYTF